MLYTLDDAEADPLVCSKNPPEMLHPGPLPSSCSRLSPPTSPMQPAFLGAGGVEGTDAASPSFLVTQEAGACREAKPAFVRFPGAGHLGRPFPTFSWNHSGLTCAADFRASPCVPFHVGTSCGVHWSGQTPPGEPCLSSALAGPAPPGAGLCTPASPPCRGRRSPAATSPPVPRFPHPWEVTDLRPQSIPNAAQEHVFKTQHSGSIELFAT